MIKKLLPVIALCSSTWTVFAQDASDNNPAFGGPASRDQARAQRIHELVEGAMPSPVVEPLESVPINLDAVQENQYFYRLMQSMQVSPSTVLTELKLTQNELADVYILLHAMETEDRRLSEQDIRTMCEAWLAGKETMTEADRATYALNAHKRLEATRVQRNAKRMNIFADLEATIGSSGRNAVEADLLAYRGRTTIKHVSWADFVNSTGKQIIQMNFSCGEDL